MLVPQPGSETRATLPPDGLALTAIVGATPGTRTASTTSAHIPPDTRIQGNRNEWLNGPHHQIPGLRRGVSPGTARDDVDDHRRIVRRAGTGSADGRRS